MTIQKLIKMILKQLPSLASEETLILHRYTQREIELVDVINRLGR